MYHLHNYDIADAPVVGHRYLRCGRRRRRRQQQRSASPEPCGNCSTKMRMKKQKQNQSQKELQAAKTNKARDQRKVTELHSGDGGGRRERCLGRQARLSAGQAGGERAWRGRTGSSRRGTATKRSEIGGVLRARIRYSLHGIGARQSPIAKYKPNAQQKQCVVLTIVVCTQ